MKNKDSCDKIKELKKNLINTNTKSNTNSNFMKPYYKKKNIEIYHTNCVDGIKNLLLKNQQIELTVTSPPYFNVKDYVKYENYKKYLDFLEELFILIYNLTKPGRMCCVNISNILIARKNRNSESKRIPLAFHFVILMEKIKWQFLEDIIWEKPEGAAKNRNGGFFQHRQPVAYKPNIVNEYILVFKKPSSNLIDKVVRSYSVLDSINSRINDKYERSNIWKINPETKSDHPAPYPLELVNNLIKYYSFVGDTVFDPFMGSGTTAVSSFKLNRKCIGFEIHSNYIDLVKSRLHNIKPNKLETKVTLNENEYKNLSKQELKKKLNKFSKNFLIEIAKQKNIYNKGDSKVELVDVIYDSIMSRGVKTSKSSSTRGVKTSKSSSTRGVKTSKSSSKDLKKKNTVEI